MKPWNTMLKRTGAVLMAAALTGALLTASASATGSVEGGTTESTEVKRATITKNITKEANTYLPNTAFSFSLVPGEAVDGSTTQKAIYSGPEGGASAESIQSAPGGTDIGETSVEVGTTSITFDGSKFTSPGIYRYKVSEVNDGYEGIAYDTAVKYFDVYVDSTGIYAYAFVNESGTEKTDGIFTNDYSNTNDLTVTKKVTGNQGDKTKKFDFDITITGAKGEQYYVEYGAKTTEGKFAKNTALTSGQQGTISLSDGQSAVIYGLSAGDTYTVQEKDYTADGYTTTYSGGDGKNTIAADTELIVTNNKEVKTPTGVAMTAAPYAVMVAAAAGIAVVFLRRGRSSDN